MHNSNTLMLAKQLATAYGNLPQVEAVAVAGSVSLAHQDHASDIDLYVYVNSELALGDRASVARERSELPEIGNTYFEPGDEWIERGSRIPVDVMFRDMDWISEQLDRVLVRHEAAMGYSTCFWFNVKNSSPLFDRNGWFAKLQEKARQAYPPELQKAIIAKNFPFLRQAQSSYLHQIEVACERKDLVALNHRIAAFLASYFDVLFAVNLQPHPGEKRLVELAGKLCRKCPANLQENATRLVTGIAACNATVARAAKQLVDGLEQLLIRESLLPVGTNSRQI